VANEGGDSVSEINAASGALIRALDGRRYGFDSPDGTAARGSRAWVTNLAGNSVT
jgi:hypothetical protein